MKRQLERLKGKRLVTGDANLMTKNEICINTTSDGGVEVKEIGVDGKIKDLAGSGGSSSSDVEYYSTSLEKVQTLGAISDVIIGFIPLVKFSFQQPGFDEMKMIAGGGIFYTFMSNNLNTLKLYGIGFTKINENGNEYHSFKDFISDIGGNLYIFDSVFTPITKEEFYDLNNI